MSRPSVDLAKDTASIQEMFAAVAPRYDLLNRLLSGSLDRWWRRRAAAAIALGDSETALDLCSGTGDQALALSRAGGRVVAADFCLPMLALARGKFGRLDDRAPRPLAGDTLRLPLPADLFDAVTVSFGLRNVSDLDAALAEILRVLRPRGRVALLEFALPTNPALAGLYQLYFRRVLPWIGRHVSARGSAYRYLPQSVLQFPQRRDFVDAMLVAGFDRPAWRDLTGGIVCLYTGSKR